MKQKLRFDFPRRAVPLIIAAVILIAVLGSSSCSKSGYTGKLESIAFGDLSVDSSLFIYIAQQQGYFSDNGINLVTKNFDTGPAALDALLKQNVDLAAMGEFPVVGKAFAKEKISVLGSTDKFQSFYLAGRKDRGIQNISDLKGKTVGLVKNALPEFYLGRMLDLHNMSIKDVTVVNVSPAQWVNAITNGDVDAIVVAQSYVSQIQTQLTDKVVIWTAQSGQSAYGLLISRNDWITQHAELVKRLLTALAQAERLLTDHPEQAQSILARRFNYDSTYLAALWPEHQFSLTLDQGLIVAMEDEARWMINNGLTAEKQVPDFRQYVYIDSLKTVKPEAVNIIR
jgi:ABC-type nitrate/sulfonate/bicarbonate transport system substrate-binding protein